MTRYLLDTNAAADCMFRRHLVDERVKAARRSGHAVGIGIPVLAELLAGVEASARRDKNLDVVNRHLRLFRLWPFTADAAREYARLFAELRRIGRPMQVMDLMIAATAISLGSCTVVTADSDFSAVPRLSVENWKV